MVDVSRTMSFERFIPVCRTDALQMAGPQWGHRFNVVHGCLRFAITELFVELVCKDFGNVFNHGKVGVSNLLVHRRSGSFN